MFFLNICLRYFSSANISVLDLFCYLFTIRCSFIFDRLICYCVSLIALWVSSPFEVYISTLLSIHSFLFYLLVSLRGLVLNKLDCMSESNFTKNDRNVTCLYKKSATIQFVFKAPSHIDEQHPTLTCVYLRIGPE